jgi:hypothetical protein
MRWLLGVWLLGVLGAADAPAAAGYAFPRDQPLWYRYGLVQETSWDSAGDHLAYTSAVRWVFALRAIETTPATATLRATIIRVEASLAGPGAETHVDSRDAVAADGPDPIFGHLVALAGTTVTLTLDQASGRVTAASGGAALITQLERKYPGAAPGEPGPISAAARALYDDAHLATWWTQLFALPAAGAIETPGATFALPRTWSDLAWTATQPTGEAPTLLLAGDPNPVSATLHDLTGSGTVAIVDGVPANGGGEVTFTLAITALTQSVQQKHHLRWTLERLTTGEP